MTTSEIAPLEITNQLGIASADRNPAMIYIASLGSEQSRRTMRTALDTIAGIFTGNFYCAGIVSNEHTAAETFQWGALRFQHTQAIRAQLAERYQYTTANKMLSALRGVLKAAYNLGYLSPDEYAKATNFKGIKGQAIDAAAGRSLAGGELRALVEVCKADRTPAGARDAALIGVQYSCGLRRAEIVALDLTDYDAESGKLTIHHSKGNKSRTVYVRTGAMMALDAWLVWRGTGDGPLFVAIGKGSKVSVRRMTTQAVYIILEKRAKQGGVKEFSPHDLRRTFAGDMLDAGADIATVAKLMGHASVTTTARYDRRSEETKKKAASLLHFPF